jgi:hypothetical protein
LTRACETYACVVKRKFHVTCFSTTKAYRLVVLNYLDVIRRAQMLKMRLQISKMQFAVTWYPRISYFFLSGSDPTAHLAFVSEIRFTEFRGEISLLAKDHAVMKNQDERDGKEQRDPVVKKKAERDLQ